MAFQFRKGSKKKGTSVRLTGLFKTKRRGLWVGSVTDLDEMKGKIKQAIAEEKGLVFFLWRNEDAEDGTPAYTISMDVSSDEDGSKKKSKPKRKPVEDDEDEDEDEPEEEEKDDDEAPF